MDRYGKNISIYEKTYPYKLIKTISTGITQSSYGADLVSANDKGAIVQVVTSGYAYYVGFNGETPLYISFWGNLGFEANNNRIGLYYRDDTGIKFAIVNTNNNSFEFNDKIVFPNANNFATFMGATSTNAYFIYYSRYGTGHEIAKFSFSNKSLTVIKTIPMLEGVYGTWSLNYGSYKECLVNQDKKYYIRFNPTTESHTIVYQNKTTQLIYAEYFLGANTNNEVFFYSQSVGNFINCLDLSNLSLKYQIQIRGSISSVNNDERYFLIPKNKYLCAEKYIVDLSSKMAYEINYTLNSYGWATSAIYTLNQENFIIPVRGTKYSQNDLYDFVDVEHLLFNIKYLSLISV